MLIEHPESVNANTFLIKCKAWFEEQYPGYTAYMTTSCTRAIEMISLSMNIQEGDEIILSPYTFVGVANALSNYGAKLVFADIDPKTMNIDTDLIEVLITDKTRAVIAMHYASIPCEMENIRQLCDKHGLLLIEDNAQGIQNTYNGKLLGSFGDFSCMSFDSLKNISCSEGGLLLCKNKWVDAVDVVYNNDANKIAFSKGLVNKYEWIGKGSKFMMSEYTAAVLYPLLLKSTQIISDRIEVWKALFQKLNSEEVLRRFIPQILMEKKHNAHLAYIKLENEEQRNKVLKSLNKLGVPCSFHYVPLDDSQEGRRVGIVKKVCTFSLSESSRLLRLPMHNFLSEEDQAKITNDLVFSVKGS
jgi:dTDP-4-amino-4,6-dideoxygalactose transaminase